MTNLPATVHYILARLPAEETFNADRIVKLLFLADWRSSLTRGHQLTETTWTVDGVDGLTADTPTDTDDFLRSLRSVSGKLSNRQLDSVLTRISSTHSSLPSEAIVVLDYVLEHAGGLDWSHLNQLVWSTRPLLAGLPGHGLNLEDIAGDYRPLSNARLEHA